MGASSALFQAIRIQPYDAVHATVDDESIRFLLQSFPCALAKIEQLRTCFFSQSNLMLTAFSFLRSFYARYGVVWHLRVALPALAVVIWQLWS